MTFTPSYQGMQSILEYYFRGSIPFQIALVNSGLSGNFPAGTSLIDALENELVNADGYARMAYTPAASVANTTDQTVDFPQFTTLQSIAGDKPPAQYDMLVILAGNKAKANVLISSIGSNTFTCSEAHGLVAGDKIFFTAASPSVSGFAMKTMYQISATGLTSTAFRIEPNGGGSAIAVSGTWTGRLIARYANGVWNSSEIRPLDGGTRAFTISPGNSHTVTADYGVGLA